MANLSFDSPNGSQSQVPAVTRAVKVVDDIARSGAAGISEIARRTGLGKSSVHALVNSLAEEGLLVRCEGGSYVLGPHLAELGAVARDHHFAEIARQELARLSEDVGETTLAGRVEAGSVRVLACVQGPGSLTLTAPIGSRLPLMAGALGKAYLASLSPERAGAFLDTVALPRLAAPTEFDRGTYLREVADARRRGFALERDEYLPGIAAAAAALPRPQGTYLFWAVAISANHGDSGLEEIGQMVMATQRSVSRALDGVRARAS